MATETKPTLEACSDDVLISLAVRVAVLPADDDWDPTIQEIREHDLDPSPVAGSWMGIARRVKAEVRRRGLEGRTGKPW